MKVVAFNGSPRKNGNTSIMIRTVFAELEAAGIETELLQVGGTPIRGCLACARCKENKDRRCIQTGDILNACLEKMIEADGIIIGSPTYFGDLTAETKALIDRAGYVARANGNLLSRKVGAGLSAVRRAGSVHVLASINNFFLLNDMIILGSSYWNLGIGREIGDVEGDAEGMQTMRDLGRNMAWLLEKLKI